MQILIFLKDGSAWRTNKFTDCSPIQLPPACETRLWERHLFCCIPVSRFTYFFTPLGIVHGSTSSHVCGMIMILADIILHLFILSTYAEHFNCRVKHVVLIFLLSQLNFPCLEINVCLRTCDGYTLNINLIVYEI